MEHATKPRDKRHSPDCGYQRINATQGECDCGYFRLPPEDECPHDEHDHYYCLECGKNLLDDFIARAELLEDR